MTKHEPRHNKSLLHEFIIWLSFMAAWSESRSFAHTVTTTSTTAFHVSTLARKSDRRVSHTFVIAAAKKTKASVEVLAPAPPVPSDVIRAAVSIDVISTTTTATTKPKRRSRKKESPESETTTDTSIESMPPKRRSKKQVPTDSDATSASTEGLTDDAKPKRRVSRKNISKEPLHWKMETSSVVMKAANALHFDNIVMNGLDGAHSDLKTDINGSQPTIVVPTKHALQYLRFAVGGNPRPLRRHRSSRGFIYNPSAAGQESFRNIVQELIFQNVTLATSHQLKDVLALQQQQPPQQPLFGEQESLIMTMVFRLRRPNQDFVGGRRGPGRLRPTALEQRLPSPRPPDVDNLAKFVLDSLNGLLYADDRQVISLHVTKLLDSDGLCLGSTEVCLQRVKDTSEELDGLLCNSFDLLSNKYLNKIE